MQQIRTRLIIPRQFSQCFTPFHQRQCQLRTCSSLSSCNIGTSGTLQALNWYKPGDVRHQKMPLNQLAVQKRGFSNNKSQESAANAKNGGLPEQIEHKCQEWERILHAEIEEKSKGDRFEWAGFKLGFRKFSYMLNTSELVLHTEQLTPEQKRNLLRFFPQNRVIEICQAAGDTAKWPVIKYGGSNITGKITKHRENGDILVTVDRKLSLEEQSGLQKCKFDIRLRTDEKFYDSQMAFLRSRHMSWKQMPGYRAMLTAFGCNGKQTMPNYGPDPMAQVEVGIGAHPLVAHLSHPPFQQLLALDQSQKLALAAALNLKRPILAVHGPPGTGKTRVLAEYLNLLRKQGKRSIVVYNQAEAFYKFLPIYSKLSGNNPNFLHLNAFDAELAKKAIEEPTIRALLGRNSFDKTRADSYKKRAVQNMEEAMAMARHNTGPFKESIPRSIDGNRELRAHLEKHAIIFTRISRSTLNMLAQLGTGFDVAILDEAGHVDECVSWWMTMPMAPCIRLFGDHNQSEPVVSSQTARQLGLQKSLLQRLDEQFPAEGFINCHLTRQYRSNPAIQAWPNRIIYGRRAAETDESVQNARLEDFVSAEKKKPKLATKLITDPLVMVDLSRLEGKWEELMFEPKSGGRSFLNWGEAILVAFHLSKLFKHIPLLPPRQIAYLTLYGAQQLTIAYIFGVFFPQLRPQLAGICTEHHNYLHSQQFEVVLRSHVNTPPPHNMRDQFYVKQAVFQMTRARRQFLYLAKREWLENGSEQSRALLATFEENGRIIGPNDLVALKPGQFRAIKDAARNFYNRQKNRRK